MSRSIEIKGLSQNNLKHISLTIPKNKIVVFTGVSGSGKSSIVFDTIAAESARQMNDTYPPFVRSRLPKYVKPEADSIENLSPSVVIDQSPLGSTARSTVGTSSQIYSALRLLFSRIGKPYAGPASFFSFNDPNGMCPECGGMGEITDINLETVINYDKSINQGAFNDTTVAQGSWYWKQIVNSGLLDCDKPLRDFTKQEMDLLMMGPKAEKKGQKPAFTGIYTIYKKRYLTRDVSHIAVEKGSRFIEQKPCPLCNGRRLNRIALTCYINGYSISDFCEMELTELREELINISDSSVKDLVDSIVKSIDRMINIGLGYLNLARPTGTLSGGEAQRVKLVRYLGSSLTDMMYIFDEPSSGMHPRDVYRMNNLLIQLRDKGNTVLVVEHDEDVIKIADEIVDVGPLAGVDGGTIVYQGGYEGLLKSGTYTGNALAEQREYRIAEKNRPEDFLPVRNANLHNLKNVNVDIPLHCICTVTGVAGSGKSSLMQVFEKQYKELVVKIDQKPITANNRSTPASYIGIMDDIRKEFAKATGENEGLFSFNSEGACPCCKGKGVIVTELAFMDPIITECEECGGLRFSKDALSKRLNGKNIIEVLSLTAKEAEIFFDNPKILKKIKALNEVGLSYLTLGQPMNTLSGGERQRIKLAVSLSKKGNIFVLDEPTTGLHPKDIGKLMELLRKLVMKGNSVVLIEHNVSVMKDSDYIIDVGPDGGNMGGEIVFTGTPYEMLNADTITARYLCTEQ